MIPKTIKNVVTYFSSCLSPATDKLIQLGWFCKLYIVDVPSYEIDNIRQYMDSVIASIKMSHIFIEAICNKNVMGKFEEKDQVAIGNLLCTTDINGGRKFGKAAHNIIVNAELAKLFNPAPKFDSQQMENAIKQVLEQGDKIISQSIIPSSSTIFTIGTILTILYELYHNREKIKDVTDAACIQSIYAYHNISYEVNEHFSDLCDSLSQLSKHISLMGFVDNNTEQ